MDVKQLDAWDVLDLIRLAEFCGCNVREMLSEYLATQSETKLAEFLKTPKRPDYSLN